MYNTFTSFRLFLVSFRFFHTVCGMEFMTSPRSWTAISIVVQGLDMLEKRQHQKKRNIANLEETINKKSWKFAESCRVSLVGLWRKWKRWGTARFDIIVNGKHCNLPSGSQCPLWVWSFGDIEKSSISVRKTNPVLNLQSIYFICNYIHIYIILK